MEWGAVLFRFLLQQQQKKPKFSILFFSIFSEQDLRDSKAPQRKPNCIFHATFFCFITQHRPFAVNNKNNKNKV